MAVLFLLAAFLGCALARPSSENVTPVEVTLYYEALCPGCQLFIPSQLLDAYADQKFEYGSLISKLTLVPYGWARVIDAGAHKYACQHGEAECEGNRLHACAIKYLEDVGALEYIACLDNITSSSSFISSVYPVDKCEEKAPPSLYKKIMNCYNSDEGWNLFAEYGKKTTSFFTSRGFVPYVSFNNKKDDDLALAAVGAFKQVLCKVSGTTDPACGAPDTKSENLPNYGFSLQP